jgi:hypothetical protein
MVRKAKKKWEYNDFQTPHILAQKAVSVIKRLGMSPKSILEPTCGMGSFLLTAAQTFPRAEKYVGVDINRDYITKVKNQIAKLKAINKFSLIEGDFFLLDWSDILASLPDPILIIGNPPWVTNAELGILESRNIPEKSNFQGRRGYDAITGKGNFDISEWMLLKHLDWLSGRCGMIAMLCKTAVARKIMYHVWKNNLPVSLTRLFQIDAQQYFGASVDACFIVIDMFHGSPSTDCHIFDNIEKENPSTIIGYDSGLVLANVALYKKWQLLAGTQSTYVWRSGIKHDCSKVMELEKIGRKYRNGSGEVIDLEDDYIYPMLKSSDIATGDVRYGRRYMLVTQQYVGEDTTAIKQNSPKLWHYLLSHEKLLAKRASSIYLNRPKFAIFGVGPYAFSPWKVAISGFYKELTFKITLVQNSFLFWTAF